MFEGTNEILTPFERRKRDYEQLKKLFDLSSRFEDIIASSGTPGTDTGRETTFVRNVLMWAHYHANKDRIDMGDVGNIFGGRDRTSVRRALEIVDSRLKENTDELSLERLRLLTETALALARTHHVDSGLQERIARYQEKEFARMMKLREEELLEAWSRNDILDELSHDGHAPAAQGQLDKAARPPRNLLTEKGPRGGDMRVLSPVALRVFQLAMAGNPQSVIAELLFKEGLRPNQKRGAVAGIIRKYFGSIRVDKTRLTRQQDENGKEIWIYEKP